jgi:uncharacterized OB-fold protein
MSEEIPSRPTPDTRNAGARYWAAAANGVLLLPKCLECGQTFWHPRPRCPHCGSARVDWIESAGRGAIHTFTIVRETNEPYFRMHVPYAVAMIDLDEGVRVMSNVVDTPLETVCIGMRVEVSFDASTTALQHGPGAAAAAEMAIPLFRSSRT